MTGTQWQQLRKSPVVEDTFLEDDWNLTVTGSDLPEDVQAVYLSSNGFNFFGVPARAGPRTAALRRNRRPGSRSRWLCSAISSGSATSTRDPAVLGKTIQMVRKNYTIVGVAASRFTWGDGDVYLPLKVTGDQTRSATMPEFVSSRA